MGFISGSPDLDLSWHPRMGPIVRVYSKRKGWEEISREDKFILLVGMRTSRLYSAEVSNFPNAIRDFIWKKP
jgi:hypothetical protein